MAVEGGGRELPGHEAEPHGHLHARFEPVHEHEHRHGRTPAHRFSHLHEHRHPPLGEEE